MINDGFTRDPGGSGPGGPIGIVDVTGLQAALNGKSPTVHSHAISDVTGLQTALDGKQGDLGTGAALQVLRTNAAGDGLEWTDPAAGGGGIEYAAGGGTENYLHSPDSGGNLAVHSVKLSGSTISFPANVSFVGSDPGIYRSGNIIGYRSANGHQFMNGIGSSGLVYAGQMFLTDTFAGSPARRQEIRDGGGNPQQRIAYSGSAFAESRVDINGYRYETASGNRWHFDDGSGNHIRIIAGASPQVSSAGSNFTLASGGAARMNVGSTILIYGNLEVEGNVGFFNKTPVAQAAYNSSPTLTDIRDLLINYGLMAAS